MEIVDKYTLKQLSELLNHSPRGLNAWLKSQGILPVSDDNNRKCYEGWVLEHCRVNSKDFSDTEIRVFRTEVDLNKSQWIQVRKAIGVLRYVYNLFLDTNKKLWAREKTGEPCPPEFPDAKYLNAEEFSKWFNNAWRPANTDKTWISEAPSKAVKEIFCRAHKAYQQHIKNYRAFSGRLAAGEPIKRYKTGKPKFPKLRFKKKFVDEPSIYFIKDGVEVRRHKIKIPIFKWLHLKEKNYIPQDCDIISGNLIIEKDRAYIALRVRVKKKQVPVIRPSGQGIGIDLGVKSLAVCSDGKVFANLNKRQGVRRLERRLRLLDRSISRMLENYKACKGEKPDARQSNNLYRAYRKREVLHVRLTRIREAYLRSVVQYLARAKPEYITLEDLNITGMVKNRHLSKAILSQKWVRLRDLIVDMCHKLGIEARIVPRWFPSSKRCNRCGHIHEGLTLKDRIFRCPHCGYENDCDLNAALNLRDAAEYSVV